LEQCFVHSLWEGKCEVLTFTCGADTDTHVHVDTLSIIRRVNSSLQKSQRWGDSQRRKVESLWWILLLPVERESERLIG